MSDSTTAGILTPYLGSPAPLEGQGLQRFLQQYVSAITGIEGALVRPRWQPEPPNQPANDATWIALGVVSRKSDAHASELHADDGTSSTIYRQQELSVLLSFFGPGADEAEARLREGVSLEQNRTYLTAAGFGLIDITDAIAVPALQNERWQYRIDATLNLRRAVVRRFPVLSIQTPDITINP